MKLSVSAYRAHASAHKKILSNSYQTQFNYGSTTANHLTSGGTSSAASHQPAPGLFAVSSELTISTYYNLALYCTTLFSMYIERTEISCTLVTVL